jgi:hypothetical protein
VTILAFALILVAIIAMVVVHFRTQRDLKYAVIARQTALDKQAKVFVRKLEASRRAGEKAIDDARKSRDDSAHLREDVIALKDSLHAILRDPRVKRLLDEMNDG